MHDVGGKEFLYAGEKSGLSEVFEDARGFDEVNKEEVATGEENQVTGVGEREEEIRWVVVYWIALFTYLFTLFSFIRY